VVNLVMYGKVVWCSEKFCRSGKIFGPLKWYTDRNWSAQSEKVGQISFRPPNFFLNSRTPMSVNTKYQIWILIRTPPNYRAGPSLSRACTKTRNVETKPPKQKRRVFVTTPV
jgi:hypothetical protein